MFDCQADESILVFGSNNQLLNAEDILSELGWSYRLIPTPKTVHKACGLALAFDADKHQIYLGVLKKAGQMPGAAYQRRGREYQAVQLD